MLALILRYGPSARSASCTNTFHRCIIFLFGLNTKLVDKNISLSEIKQEIDRHINKEWKKEEIETAARNYTKNPLIFLSEYLACKNNDQKFILPVKYEIAVDRKSVV